MTTLEVRKEGKVWQAGGLGSFTYSGWKSNGQATTSRGRELTFSLKGWTHGRAEIVEHHEVIGEYRRGSWTQHNGTISVVGAEYEFTRTGGMFGTTYALRQGGETLAEFKVKGALKSRIEGELSQDVDPVVGLFYLWLIWAFHNDDAAAASAGAGA